MRVNCCLRYQEHSLSSTGSTGGEEIRLSCFKCDREVCIVQNTSHVLYEGASLFQKFSRDQIDMFHNTHGQCWVSYKVTNLVSAVISATKFQQDKMLFYLWKFPLVPECLMVLVDS